MLVTRGERALMGRQPWFPKGLFSALAGFVEPGETIEEAVRREVMEEAAIEVGAVRYHSSQPWPYPSSLMIGCLAEGLSEAITIDGHEIETAKWFERELLREAVTRAGARGADPFRENVEGVGPDGLLIPAPMAIAHQLVRHWACGEDA